MQVVENVRLLDCLDEVPGEVSRLRGAGVDVGYDIETTDLDPINSRMVALQFKPKGRTATILDVRHFTPGDLRLLGAMLEPLFDGQATLIGHNLKFDLEFALAQMGLAGHRVYDTMLAEQVIWGLGVSSAREKKVHFGMADLADRYKLSVSKEERSWFIGLDTRVEYRGKVQVGTRAVPEVFARDENDRVVEGVDGTPIVLEWGEEPVYADAEPYRPWDAPFPVEQIRYMRQDVSIVHRIKEAQQAVIERDGLQEVIDLEMRALFALVGVEVFGVSINREGWLQVIDRVEARARELETILHLGKEPTQDESGKCVDPGFEGLDIHILKVRNENYMNNWRPYEEWMKARDAFVATRKAEWEQFGNQFSPATKDHDGPVKGWGEYKKICLDWWYERHEKLTKPPVNKAGVNLGSWMQVRDGFNDLGIPVTSVSEETLTPYIGKHPLVQVYINYSHARKIVTVYGRERNKKSKSFIELLDDNNRLRASYQQIGADTGRMSSYNPNFQQIPTDGVGSELRKNVVAAPGHVFVVADFSNIELRIVAELSGDQFLLDAFASGRDVHAYTAKVMFGLAEEQATKAWTDSHNAVVGGKELESTSYRKVAKTINYMLLYGAGVKRLAMMLRIAEADSKALLQLYYKTFATAIGWLNDQKSRLDQAKKAHETKVYSETRSGRRRWFDIPVYPKSPMATDDLSTGDGQVHRVTVEALDKYNEEVAEWKKQNASIKRQLANTPVQGLSADITKEAAARWYEHAGYDEAMRLVAIIHDEFIVEARPNFAKGAGELLEQLMREAMQKYLWGVDLGEAHAVQTSHWEH